MCGLIIPNQRIENVPIIKIKNKNNDIMTSPAVKRIKTCGFGVLSIKSAVLDVLRNSPVHTVVVASFVPLFTQVISTSRCDITNYNT